MTKRLGVPSINDSKVVSSSIFLKKRSLVKSSLWLTSILFLALSLTAPTVLRAEADADRRSLKFSVVPLSDIPQDAIRQADSESQEADSVPPPAVPDALASDAILSPVALGQSHYLYFRHTESGLRAHLYHRITDTHLEDVLISEKNIDRVELIEAQAEHVWFLRTSEGELFKLIYNAHKTTFTLLDYGVILLYLLSMVWIGYYFSKREKSSDDFFEGGHRVPFWAVGVSLFATGASAISFMGMPAKAYETNWIYFTTGLFQVLLLPLAFYVVIPVIRRLKINTAYEYLDMRFGYPVRVYSSVLFVALQVLSRMSVVLLLPAIALNAVTGINIQACVLIMGVLSTVYTLLGGIQAVIWTDVIQTFVIIGAVIICIVIIAFQLDGSVGENLALASEMGKFELFDWSPHLMAATTWAIILQAIFHNFQQMSDQNYVQRIQAVNSESAARKVVSIQLLIAVPLNMLFFALGTALFLFYRTHPIMLEPHLQTDTIFPLYIMQNLPVGVAGLVVAGIFAASMSTLDSSINSVSMVIVRDFFEKLKHNATDQASLRLGKIMTILLGSFATLTALLFSFMDMPSIWDFFIMMTGLISSGVGGVFCLGMFTKRASTISVLIGATLGFATTLYIKLATEVSFFVYLPVGIMATFIAGYLFAFVFPNRKNITGFTILDLPKSENA